MGRLLAGLGQRFGVVAVEGVAATISERDTPMIPLRNGRVNMGSVCEACLLASSWHFWHVATIFRNPTWDSGSVDARISSMTSRAEEGALGWTTSSR